MPVSPLAAVSEDYLGATESELRDAPLSRRSYGYGDQRALFPHAGQLHLEPRPLVLGRWRVLDRAAITSVDLTFTDVYRRGQAAGVRGNWASLGFIGNLGKPLVLGLAGGEPVYLLIDFRYFTGVNQARRWVPILRDWIRQAASV
jgi:hypothetical protein